VRKVSLILLALVVASALAVLPAAARTSSAARVHHKLFVAVKRNMPAAAEKKLVIGVDVNQHGGPFASSEATPSKPAVFIQQNHRRYLVKVFFESSCKGVCETKSGYRISGAARHKLMVIPTCQYANKVFTCSKLRVVKVY
jgi:type II secretory pathway component PulJ